MKTITKRADELKPGDVVIRAPSFGPMIALTIKPANVPNRLEVQHFSQSRETIDHSYFAPDDVLVVEAPLQLVTREQLDLLLDVASAVCGGHIGVVGVDPEHLAEVVDALRPPSPPTLEEALALITKMRGRIQEDQGLTVRDVNDFLDRARRSGKLK